MRRLALIALLALALPLAARASTVGWGAADDHGLGLYSGAATATAPVPVGCLVRLGYFSGLDATAITSLAAAGDKTSLNAAFREFDSATIGTGTNAGAPYAGLWQNSGINVGAQFAGQRMFYWTYNAASLADATQWGIFASPSWTFPSDPSAGQTTSDLNQVPVNASGILAGQSTLGTATIAGVPNFPVYRLAVIVPEPASVLLFVSGLLIPATRRRRLRV